MILVGDCREVMAGMAAASVDAIVTDPPYGLEFMGKEWDNIGAKNPNPHTTNHQNFTPKKSEFKQGVGTQIGAPKKNPRCTKCGKVKHSGTPCTCANPEWDTRTREYAQVMQAWHETWAREAFRVLKPGGHLLAFSGTRTSHRMVSAIEDAGFEIRDSIMWVFGSGFPKSLDVSKAIDKAAGAEREIVGRKVPTGGVISSAGSNFRDDGWKPDKERLVSITAPATPEAERWAGWGTALKPSHEPICVARKPLTGTVAHNVTKYGTGAINIDATRIVTGQRPDVIMDAWGNDQHLCSLCAEDAGRTPKPGLPGTGGSTALSSAEPTMSERGAMPLAATCKADTGCSDTHYPAGPSDDPSMCGSLSIGASGKTTTDLSQTVMSSTTSTKSRRTTASRTCASCGDPITSHTIAPAIGRWPSNTILSDSAVAALDEQSGERSRKEPNPVKTHTASIGYHGTKAPFVGTNYTDTGGASRFFLTVPDLPIDVEDVTRCWLCEGLKHDIMSATKESAQWPESANNASNHSTQNGVSSGTVPDPAPALLPPDLGANNLSDGTNARSVVTSSTNTPETIGSTALPSADTTLGARLVPRVKSAGNLCGSCATAIARRLAATLLGLAPESLPGLGYITASRNSILNRSLVSYVEPMVGTGIIPTTASLSILFGSVRAAMQSSTPIAGTVNDPGLTRFLYKSKASRAERNAGLDGMPEERVKVSVPPGEGRSRKLDAITEDGKWVTPPRANHHPTVKPIALMKWLITLVTPPGGTVLDPFAGSGSTGCAAAVLGVDFVGIEQDAEYAAIAERRIAYWAGHSKPKPLPQLPLFAEQAAD
jgi:DNA modification methylase